MKRCNVALGAFALLAFGCQDGPDARAASADATGTFALAQASCRYDGPMTFPAGRVTFTLTSVGGAAQYDLWLLDDGRTYEEFVDHIDEERERIQAGDPPLGHPDFATLASEGSTDDTGSGTLTAPLEPGTYGMACIRFDPEPGLWPSGPVVIER